MFRVFLAELKDTVIYELGVSGIMSLLLKQTLCAAFGPIGAMLPDATAFLAKVATKSYQEIQASYDVHTTRSGLLVAEHQNPSILYDSSIILPDHYETPIERLTMPDSYSSHFELLGLQDANLIRSSLGALGTQCQECKQHINWSYDHSPTCSQHPLAVRPVSKLSDQEYIGRKCPACGMYVLGNIGHSSNCTANLFNKPSSPRLGSFLQSYNAPLETFQTYITGLNKCDECGNYISKSTDHKAYCSKYPFYKPTHKSISFLTNSYSKLDFLIPNIVLDS